MNVTCKECKNDKKLTPEDAVVGRWFECNYCGTTYEITAIDDEGSLEFQMIEEEK